MVLKFLNKSLATIQELNFQKKEVSGGLGSSEIHLETDNQDKWRIHDVSYYTTLDLNFDNNKHIYVLLERDRVRFLFLPLKNDTYLISDDYSYGISTVKSTSLYKTNYLETFESFQNEKFVSLYKNNNNKYELVNSFKEKLLEAEYDTIMHNQFFIIGKNEGQIDIFNSNYEKLKISNVKSAYLYRSGLDVLNDKGANYYNSALEIINKFPAINYTLCGTVSYEKYIIEYDKYFNIYILKRIEEEAFSNQGKRSDFQLAGIKKRDKVTFLNSENKFYWDGNSDFTREKYIDPNYLIITRKNKSGIYKYEYWSSNYGKIVDVTGINFNYPEEIEPEVILPITYKNIIYNPKDGLVYFYNRNEVGIFPRHKTVQYQSINQITNSFYEITRKQKKGWLDINTNIEYFNN